MKLHSCLMIVLLMTVCIAPPPDDFYEALSEKVDSLGVEQNSWSNCASRANNQMFLSTAPKLHDFEDTHTQFTQLSEDILNIIALQMHNNKDVKNLALSFKAFHYSPTVKIIRNIRRFCLVKGDRVFPNLELAAPPTAQCAESIIASNGYFHIETLRLTKVRMTQNGAHSIASIVQLTRLLNLTIRECQLTFGMLVSITNALPESEVTTLGLARNRIGAEGASEISAILADSMLTSLDLELNEIGAKGAKAIAEALPESKLTLLHLKYNHIGDDGANDIAAALPYSEVTTLNLEFNRIGAEGAKAIAAAMPHSKLKSLFLGDNNIGEMGASAIAEALPDSKLASLDVQWNRIGDGGASAIVAALPSSDLLFLALNFNLLSFSTVRALNRRAALMRRAEFELRLWSI